VSSPNEDERRLEASYSEAAKVYSHAVAKPANARRSLPKSEYLSAYKKAEGDRFACEEARLALESFRVAARKNQVNGELAHRSPT